MWDLLAKAELGSLARLGGSGVQAESQPSASVLVQQEFKDLKGIFLPDIKNAVGSRAMPRAGICQRGFAGEEDLCSLELTLVHLLLLDQAWSSTPGRGEG